MKVEGIAIRHSKYKDYHAMITLLTKDKILSFKAPNAYKILSKFFLLVTNLMYGEYVFSDSKDYLSLKEVNPIIDTRGFVSTCALGCTINALNEIILKVLSEEDAPKIYPYIVAALKKLDILTTSSSHRSMTPLLVVLANAIKISGYGLEVDKCVITNSTKEIVGISLIDGGLVSKSVFDPNKHIQYNPYKINIIRAAFKAKPEDIRNLEFDPEMAREIIRDLILYVKDTTNTVLRSVSLIDYLTL